jgi:HK97 family phage portal protein
MQLPDLFGVRKLTKQVESLHIELQQKAASQQIAASFTNFNTQIFPHYNVIKEEIIYQIMDDIYSVVSRLSATAASIPFYAETQDGQDIQPKDKLNDFLKTLTFEQKEIFYTTLYLQGEIFAWKEKIDFGVNAGVQRLKNLNPAKMVVIISRDFPTDIVGYRYYDSYNGYSKDFGLDEIMYVKTFNPTSDIQKQFRGFSAVTALKQRLTRVQSSLDVSIAQMQNGGVPGVMYEKMPMAPGAMGQRQDNFAKFLSNSANTGAPYMLNGDVGYFAIGSALADMQLAELASIDFDKICNAFSVSSINFNNKEASTRANVTELRKDLFTNAVLPQVKRLEDGLNMQVVQDIRTTGVVCYDISDVQELQVDLKSVAEGLAASPVMRPNDVLEKLGFNRDDNPDMDKWFIKNGYTPIEDMASPAPLPNVAGDYIPQSADAATPVKVPAA